MPLRGTCHKVAAQAALQQAPDAACGLSAPDVAIHEKIGTMPSFIMIEP